MNMNEFILALDRQDYIMQTLTDSVIVCMSLILGSY